MVKKDPKVAQLGVGLKLEKQLRQDIFEFLQYDAVSVVMNQVGYWFDSVSSITDEIFKNSIRVSDDLLGNLHEMLLLAKGRLGFKEPVELYVVNNHRINACASLSFDGCSPHLIQLNSALINSMSDDELLSVIGHELGHLMGRDAEMNRLMSFIYCDEKEVPWFINAKLQMLSQLNEIRCDRCGCIASGRLEPNVTSQFSLMCGINFNRFGGDVQGLLSRCSDNIELIKDGSILLQDSSHPEDPIRIRAMEIFFNNDDKKKMEKEMEEIISLVSLWRSNEMDKHYADFVVSAGLLVANMDGNITNDEISAIVSNVLNYKMFPIKDYKKIAKKDIETTFRKSVSTILENEPFRANYLMKYILRIMVADQHISPSELHFAYDLSRDVFNLEIEEFSQCYAEVIREFFNPRFKM